MVRVDLEEEAWAARAEATSREVSPAVGGWEEDQVALEADLVKADLVEADLVAGAAGALASLVSLQLCLLPTLRKRPTRTFKESTRVRWRLRG